ncbi:MAG: histidine--tRNA ligase [Clostridiaceae bacterium]|nr:histidine--tRNA ligase [Clostridiaceae bacterium]
MLTKAPRGTKDILPAEVYKWQYIENTITEVCNKFGYRQIRVPVFEHTELFEHGVGDTTDVVQKEMYTFPDKGGRSITLRPEGTSGVVRAYVENNLYAAPAPVKLYYILSCYRYEKPQAGRLREFNQFGIELFGADTPQSDGEVLLLAHHFMQKLGLKNFKLYINSIGCDKCRPRYNKKLIEYFTEHQDKLCGTCRERLTKNPMRIIDCKNKPCKAIGESAPMLIEEQCPDCKAHFEKVKEFIASAGVEFEIDPTIVRGLDYYTTTVFEIKVDGVVICGGGRYNNLVEQIGGPPSPGIGFGLGLERLIIALENENLFPENKDCVNIFIAAIGENAAKKAFAYVSELRKNEISAQNDLLNRSIKSQMKYADKIGAEYVLVLGDDEISSGIGKLKNMRTGAETAVKLEDLTAQLIQIIKIGE